MTQAIDQYCSRLLRALHKVPSPERDEIVREVRGHILERVEVQPRITEEVLTEILRAVGDPKELASEYRTQEMLRQATTSSSPWSLLRATLRWATTGVVGVIAFLATTIGYGCATAFFLCALLKSFFPSRIGLWLGPEHTLTFGYWNGRLMGVEVYGISVRPPASFALLGTLGSTNGPFREVLGYWLIPEGILCGAFFFLVTTLFARWLVRRFVRNGKKASHSVSLDHSIERFGSRSENKPVPTETRAGS